MATEAILEIVELMSNAEEWAKKQRGEIAGNLRGQIKSLEKLTPVTVPGGASLKSLQKAKEKMLAGLKKMVARIEGLDEFSIKADLQQYLLVRNHAKMSDELDSEIDSLVTKIAEGTVTVADFARYLLLGGET
jgi:hypothetical protein